MLWGGCSAMVIDCILRCPQRRLTSVCIYLFPHNESATPILRAFVTIHADFRALQIVVDATVDSVSAPSMHVTVVGTFKISTIVFSFRLLLQWGNSQSCQPGGRTPQERQGLAGGLSSSHKPVKWPGRDRMNRVWVGPKLYLSHRAGTLIPRRNVISSYVYDGVDEEVGRPYFGVGFHSSVVVVSISLARHATFERTWFASGFDSENVDGTHDIMKSKPEFLIHWIYSGWSSRRELCNNI